jgi:redox-sensitive bicupin YhaK (pirin superfamily)
MNEPGTTVEVLIHPATRDLGDGFQVRRALPNTQRRMVGPFVFLDQMGPSRLAPGQGLDVRPHPHIGLATVTYLSEGEILHRDSLGSVQAIRPGDVNWMTAGRGIVHSERSPAEARTEGPALAGLQCWVALPQALEECAPAFVHHPAASLPVAESGGTWARVIAGRSHGLTSPVATLSPMFYVELKLQPGARFELAPDYAERAVYIVEGRLDLGADGVHEPGRLIVFKPGGSVVLGSAGPAPLRAMLLGGEPMDGPRYLSWNFVASSAERLQQAADDWRAGRFPQVPGETEFIPMPDLPGRPAHYP